MTLDRRGLLGIGLGLVCAPADLAAAPPTDPALYVLKREDGRVVYHLGALLPPPPADGDPNKTHHLGAYSVGSFNVPVHWWWSRWTDRTNCPIKIVRSPSDIVKARRAFPYGDTGIPLGSPARRVPYTIMGSSWVTKNMGITGERQDIGLIHDASGIFMLGGDPGSMIDAALSAESVAFHVRDQATDKPIDLIRYPSTNSFDHPGFQGSPWIARGPFDPGTDWSRGGGEWVYDINHACEMSYMAHEATGDLGFLEDLCYAANVGPIGGAGDPKTGAKILQQQRGVAWGLRNFFMAHIATKDLEAKGPLPGWLHPSAYWKKLLDNTKAYYAPQLNSGNTTMKVYGSNIGEGSKFSPWCADYMATALGFGVLTGHADWQAEYVFALGNTIARTNNKSGFPPGLGTPYRINCYEWAKKPDGTLDKGGRYDMAKPLNWHSAFLYMANDYETAPPTAAQFAALAADPLNAGVAMYGHEYLLTTRAVLVQALYLDSVGLAPIRATYPELDSCFALVDKMVRAARMMAPRQSCITDPNRVSKAIVPYVA